MSWKENAGELESRLDYSYNRQQTAVKSGGSPAYAGTQKRGMPFFIKLLHQKRKKEVLKTGIGSSEFPSEDSLVKELSSVKNELEDVIASIEDMWFQVDAINDRIVVKPSSNGNEKYSDVSCFFCYYLMVVEGEWIYGNDYIIVVVRFSFVEKKHNRTSNFANKNIQCPFPTYPDFFLSVHKSQPAALSSFVLFSVSQTFFITFPQENETLISIQSGTLVLTRKELIWSSSRSFNGVGTGVELEAGIRLPYSSITRFTYGRLDHTSIPHATSIYPQRRPSTRRRRPSETPKTVSTDNGWTSND
ncbi:hypothetical protein BC829DRAFT_115938 [Chytridium lagenaria]|nr:hypothetical protein BC829DRAFT_115938 [Chytridium lagenaria]